VSAEKFTTEYHAPVLVAEVLSHLAVRPGGRYLDGTVGGGGHTAAILEACGPDGKVLALDRDGEAIAEVKRRLQDEVESGRLTLVEANYSQAADVLQESGWAPVDGWLVDAGVSSHQFDQAERGFSFQHDGPLDMRMGQSGTTVAELLDEVDADELADLLFAYGELKKSRRIARKILEARQAGSLNTTAELADVAVRAVGWRERSRSINPATLVFQALRIAVNQELEHLTAAVRAIPEVVKEEGRAVFISFHSLEDRIVKHEFRRLEDPCTCPKELPECVCAKISAGRVLTRRPVTPGEEELDQNPRARSAKLRVFLRARQ
jgi:16S rRNA (cytosine1402-N4)-methyltransferase